jgi:hypothetical protein
MNEPSDVPQPWVPLGSVEPHAELLKRPQDTHLLYKVMKLDNMVSSIRDVYLHFNRIDRYRDFDTADSHDGEQFPADRERDASIMFGKEQDFGRRIL